MSLSSPRKKRAKLSGKYRPMSISLDVWLWNKAHRFLEEHNISFRTFAELSVAYFIGAKLGDQQAKDWAKAELTRICANAALMEEGEEEES